ncbi:uncharacterized protein LOC121768705 [Salvia splendens]|uniref:uncharacterized protein LOC121768705 n=1 Tax=Salvia splendens TaxID=180675 RepID=UPI001C266BA2|nr:uncharacterized protein LOC121768705 [Salvia splendens]
MASSMKSCLLLSLAFSISIHATFAEVICENLPENLCAFAVATSGKRCALESYKGEGTGNVVEYTCTTSEVVVAERLAGRIESDQCVAACGVDRSSVGISSDAFMMPEFISSLCSPSCYQNCPNIVDLYFNLAAGEGVFLPALCEKQRSNPHRAMLELLSSGGAAPATVDDSFAPAPAPSSYY